MKDDNRITLVGTIAEEPHFKISSVEFIVESHRKFTGGDGNQHAQDLVLCCRGFGQVEDATRQHGHRGVRVLVAGTLETQDAEVILHASSVSFVPGSFGRGRTPQAGCHERQEVMT